MLCPNFAYPKLMEFFEEISRIPRGSGNEQGMADFLCRFAEERGLACYRDEIHNVLIDLPATPGYEEKPAILLQGHTDMVCEKNEGVEHDFLKDPLSLYLEDGWLRARGTTLGADNGVAVAVMMAVLDGVAPHHPAIQCLFTVSEEVGMVGAKAFDCDRIRARMLINMDGADDKGTVICGCAGGLRTAMTLPVRREPSEGVAMTLTVKGLCGGHSGEDIHRGRANAIKVLGRMLRKLSMGLPELRLISVHGGTVENAIPREAGAELVVGDARQARSIIETISREIRGELIEEDSGFVAEVSLGTATEMPMDEESTKRAIFLIIAVATGVLEMHPRVRSVVGYSRNLGVIRTEAGQIAYTFSSRSELESQLDRAAEELDAFAAMAGAEIRHFNRYPGWHFEERSELRRRYVRAYETLFGVTPGVEILHAGLECGVLRAAIPDLDLISCGPMLLDLHSPDEALNVESFERFFTLILEMLGQ